MSDGQEGAAGEGAETPLAKGNVVKIHGLQGPEFLHFNGEIGEVAGMHPQLRDRVYVRLKNRALPFHRNNLRRIVTRDERDASERLQQRREDMRRDERPHHTPFTSLLPVAQQQQQHRSGLPADAPVGAAAYQSVYPDPATGSASPSYRSPLGDPGLDPNYRHEVERLREQQEREAASPWGLPEGRSAFHVSPVNVFSPPAAPGQPVSPFAPHIGEGAWEMPVGGGDGGGGGGVDDSPLRNRAGNHPNSPLNRVSPGGAAPAVPAEGGEGGGGGGADAAEGYRNMAKLLDSASPVEKLLIEKEIAEKELLHLKKASEGVTDSVLKWKLFVLDQKKRVEYQDRLIRDESKTLEESAEKYGEAMQTEIGVAQTLRESAESSDRKIREEIIPDTLARNYVLSTAPRIVNAARAHAGIPKDTWRDPQALSWPEKHRILKAALKDMGVSRTGSPLPERLRERPQPVVLNATRVLSEHEAARFAGHSGRPGAWPPGAASQAGHQTGAETGSGKLTYQLRVSEKFFAALRAEVGTVTGSRDGDVAVLDVTSSGREELVGLQVVVNEDFLRFLCDRAGHKGIEVAVWDGARWECCTSRDFWKWRHEVVSRAPSAVQRQSPLRNRAELVTIHITSPSQPALTGFYVEQSRVDANCFPTYLNASLGYLLYTDCHGRWKVGSLEESAHSLGVLKSKYPHSGVSPWDAPSWLCLGGGGSPGGGLDPTWEEDAGIRVVACPDYAHAPRATSGVYVPLHFK